MSHPEQASLAQRITPPTSAEVHVWVADLRADPVESARRFDAATRPERERGALFWRREDGDRYISAHGVLRLLLGHYLDRAPHALNFATGQHGKPFLPDAGLEFNLSHSSDLALIAVACGRRVGVDVERLHPMPGLDDVATRVCTSDELVILASLAEPARTDAFLGFWTRKEALAKATGEGIQGVMRGTGSDPASKVTGTLNADWTVVDITDLPGYAASVAAEGTGWKLVRRNVTESNGTR